MAELEQSAPTGQAEPAPLVRVRNSSRHMPLKKRRGRGKKKKVRIPKTPQGQFLFFFFLELMSCAILVAATRAEAQGNYFWNHSALSIAEWGRGCNLGLPTVTLLGRGWLLPKFPALHLLGPVATGVDAGLPVRPHCTLVKGRANSLGL